MIMVTAKLERCS